MGYQHLEPSGVPHKSDSYLGQSPIWKNWTTTTLFFASYFGDYLQGDYLVCFIFYLSCQNLEFLSRLTHKGIRFQFQIVFRSIQLQMSVYSYWQPFSGSQDHSQPSKMVHLIVLNESIVLDTAVWSWCSCFDWLATQAEVSLAQACSLASVNKHQYETPHVLTKIHGIFLSLN